MEEARRGMAHLTTHKSVISSHLSTGVKSSVTWFVCVCGREATRSSLCDYALNGVWSEAEGGEKREKEKTKNKVPVVS